MKSYWCRAYSACFSAYVICSASDIKVPNPNFCNESSDVLYSSEDGSDSEVKAPLMSCLEKRNFTRRVFDLSFLSNDHNPKGKTAPISSLEKKKRNTKTVSFNCSSEVCDSHNSQSTSGFNKTKETEQDKKIKGILKQHCSPV